MLSCVRYGIDTVFGQLVDRCAVKRVWAQDRWYLCSRLLRTVLIPALVCQLALLRQFQTGSDLQLGLKPLFQTA